MSHEVGGETPSSLFAARGLPPSPSVSPASFVLDNASQRSTPRLGDFSRVLATRRRPTSQASSYSVSQVVGKNDEDRSEASGVQTPISSTKRNDAESGLQPKTSGLGNFSKIFQRLSPPGRSISDGYSTRPLSASSFSSLAPSPSPLGFQQLPIYTSITQEKPIRKPYTRGDADRIESPLAGSPPTTPPTSLEGDIPTIPLHTDDEPDLTAQIRQAKVAFLKAQADYHFKRRGLNENEWLCDWFAVDQRSVRHSIKEKLMSREEAHESLCDHVVPLRLLDAQVATAYPGTVANGIHIFLDYSNINIAFQHFLKSHYSLPESARLSPTPNINLEFLHELLIRGRVSQTLFAGGSVGHRDHHEPSFAQELRKLRYTVDLRERVRVEEPSVRGLYRSSGKSSSDETFPKFNGSQKSARFKEEFVDESLQSRIAAITLDFLDTPGTLIFVTGDGRPAPYADGFVKYAERALRRGFNIEVVSWSRSLSSAWDELRTKQEWENRFRVISLDPFWKDLVPVFANHG